MSAGAGVAAAIAPRPERPAPSRWRAWLVAARPHTLGASLVPVLVGSAVAAREDQLVAATFAVCALAAIALQVTTNLANDAFDHLHAIDTPDRVGPARVTQSGWLSARQVLFGVGVALAVALLCGIYLVAVGGIPILIIGCVSALAALAYSAGPFPLASHGLGELAAFGFFGVVAVCGSAYLHAGDWSSLALTASLPVGCLESSIMVVNNLRDIESDARCGKRTLAVRIGARATRALYAALLMLASLLCIGLAWQLGSWSPLLPWLSAPLAWRAVQTVRSAETAVDFGRALAGTARLHAVFGVLLCLSLLF